MLECCYCQDKFEFRPTTGGLSLYACQTCLNPFLISTKTGGQPEVMPLVDNQDIRTIIPPESLGNTILSVLREAVDQMPVLPEISRRAIALAQDEKSSASDLAKLIEQDAVIAVKIIRAANSALYGGLQPISDIRAACARLGMRTVISLLQAVATEHFYKSNNPLFDDLIRRLWRHGLVTAHCAGEIARILSEPRPDAIFLAGLVHDVGRLVLLDIVASRAHEAQKILQESPELLFEILDSFHELVGLHVVQHWCLAPEFPFYTYFHHRPDVVPESVWAIGCHIVCLADELAAASGYGFGVRKSVSLVAHPSSRFLGLTDIKLAAFRVDLEDRISSLFDALAD